MSMHSQFLAVVLAVTLSVAACAPDNGPLLDAPQALALVQAGKLTLIDIRRPEEWRETGVAVGAVRISMAHVEGTAGFVRQVGAELGGDRNAPVGLIGRSGSRSGRMQQALLDAGFTQAYNIRQGMAGSGAGPGWIARGLPLEP